MTRIQKKKRTFPNFSHIVPNKQPTTISYIPRIIRFQTVRKISFVEQRKAFSLERRQLDEERERERETSFISGGGLTRQDWRWSIVLLGPQGFFSPVGSPCVVSCQGQGSSLEPDLFPTGATGPATWDIPDDLGPHGQFARFHSLQMGPYRRLINHQVTRPLLYKILTRSSTRSRFSATASSFYSPLCFRCALLVWFTLHSILFLSMEISYRERWTKMFDRIFKVSIKWIN